MFTQRDFSARIIAASVAAFVCLGPATSAAASQSSQVRSAAGHVRPEWQARLLYSFSGPEGANPQGALVAARDNWTTNIFGATQSGGTAGDGALFKFVPQTDALTTVVDFAGTNGLLPAGGLSGDRGQFSRNGIFIGVTQFGGANGLGAIYAASGNGAQTVLYSFTGAADGSNPVGSIVQYGGSYYGTTSTGAGGYGTVFRYKPGQGLTTLHTFANGNDGATPLAGLALQIEIPHGNTAARLAALSGNAIDAAQADPAYISPVLFGVASAGGAGGLGNGTIFSITPNGTFKTLFTFQDTTVAPGAGPQAELVSDFDGNLFGSTFTGGSAGVGELFELNKNGAFSVIHDFGFDATTGLFPTGANPAAPLTITYRGTIYGTASSGSLNGLGNVFEILSGHNFFLRHEFAGPDGVQPQGKLIDIRGGNLYGTTYYGGASGVGTIYTLPE